MVTVIDTQLVVSITVRHDFRFHLFVPEHDFFLELL
jgi:hypothetical protein